MGGGPVHGLQAGGAGVRPHFCDAGGVTRGGEPFPAGDAADFASEVFPVNRHPLLLKQVQPNSSVKERTQSWASTSWAARLAARRSLA